MFKYKSNKNKYGGQKALSVIGIHCLNCGKANHIMQQCTDPITSYGLLCFYNTNTNKNIPTTKHLKGNTPGSKESVASSVSLNIVSSTGPMVPDYKLLMICRKHSIPYIDFLRGKYDVANMRYIFELLSKMTVQEVIQIVDWCDFSRLRYDLGLNDSGKPYKTEYETSALKFNYLLKLGQLHRLILCYNRIYKTSYVLKKQPETQLPTIEQLLNEPDVKAILADTWGEQYKDPEWGLPKGKREHRETDLQCALREFSEETGIEPGYVRIYKNVVPLEESYVGMNNVHYKHIYFIGELENISADMVEQLESGVVGSDYEVSRVRLGSLASVLNWVRSYHMSKKSVIQKAFYIMSQFNTFFNAF
jgi:hypothetical protein